MCEKAVIPPVPTTKALATIGHIIVETVKEAGPMGMPGGHLYAALNAYGMSLGLFETFMGALVGAGRLRKSGELYFVINT